MLQRQREGERAEETGRGSKFNLARNSTAGKIVWQVILKLGRGSGPLQALASCARLDSASGYLPMAICRKLGEPGSVTKTEQNGDHPQRVSVDGVIHVVDSVVLPN